MAQLYQVSNFDSTDYNLDDYTVVFIHGNSTNLDSWQSQLNFDMFSPFRLLAFDLPGHGKSLRLPEYSIPTLTTILAEQINTCGKVLLVGHSLGGHLAIEALPHLNNCVAAFLFGTPPVKKPINLQEAFLPDPRMGLLFKGDLSSSEIGQFADAVCSGHGKNGYNLAAQIRDTDPKFRESIGVSVAKGELTNEVGILENIDIPIAMVNGADDAFVNPDYLANVTIPSLWEGKIHTIEGSGHSPHRERPEHFNRLLLRFLNDLK